VLVINYQCRRLERNDDRKWKRKAVLFALFPRVVDDHTYKLLENRQFFTPSVVRTCCFPRAAIFVI